jgi:hypothetical protein
MPGHRMALMTGLAHTTGDLIFLSDSDLDEEPRAYDSISREVTAVDCEVVFGFQGPRVAEERRALIPSPAAGRPIKPLIESLRDLQRSFDLVDATQVLIDP